MDVQRLLDRLERTRANIYTAEPPDLARMRANVMYIRRCILHAEQALGRPMRAEKRRVEGILQEIEDRQSETSIKEEVTEEKVSEEAVVLETTEQILMHHREMAEVMTQEMLRLAKGMKVNAQAMGQIAERDQMLISSAGELLAKNINTMQNTNQRLGQYKKAGKGTFWLNVLSIAIVFTSFIIVFFVVHLT
ncbi:hypothetical protein PORY_001613 [Pneumocystis oryctolagi]|uniref:Uncharacterized protein n=1 Tax=Pneumocystis oryctolagi TaxID=42067 RepID=A0ACB7CDA0_9ASCO|nr:hypothetical protein PORY_001613 [Pneumocystis oryctolagi]